MLNLDGCKELVMAVYRLAVEDYTELLVSHDTGNREMARIEQFLVSGSYQVDPELGRYMITKCHRTVELAEELLEEYLSSEKEKQVIHLEDTYFRDTLFAVAKRRGLRTRVVDGTSLELSVRTKAV